MLGRKTINSNRRIVPQLSGLDSFRCSANIYSESVHNFKLLSKIRRVGESFMLQSESKKVYVSDSEFQLEDLYRFDNYSEKD